MNVKTKAKQNNICLKTQTPSSRMIPNCGFRVRSVYQNRWNRRVHRLTGRGSWGMTPLYYCFFTPPPKDFSRFTRLNPSHGTKLDKDPPSPYTSRPCQPMDGFTLPATAVLPILLLLSCTALLILLGLKYRKSCGSHFWTRRNCGNSI